ncbi:MAG: acyl-CoA dehydrogenase family protein [Anaerotardibacter sp.]
MYQLEEEERMIIAMVDSISEDILSERAAQIDEEDEFPEDMYQLIVEQGLFGLAMPEEYGGFPVSINCWAQCVSRLAQESPAVALLLFVTAVGSDALITHGSEEQKAKYLPELITGEKKISFALTEPNAGSDVWNMGTTARPTEGGYIISGNKLFISNAEVADYFCLFAMVDDGESRKPTAFLVEADTPGLSVSAKEKKLGLHGSPTCPIFFEKMFVPESAIIGKIGQGAEIAYHALNRGRIAIAASALGITKACLKASATYSLDRKQFGQPIADFQAINSMLANMKIGITASELFIDQAIEAFVNDDKDVKNKVSMAKVYCTEVANRAANDAVQIHGGYGFCKEYPVERYYRDSKAFTIITGTNQIQKKLIAADIKKEYAL